MTEEAPSEMDEEFAAVTVPFFLKAGLRVGIFVISDLKGCSSLLIIISFFLFKTLMGTISDSNVPSSFAFLALFKEVIAILSCCSLVNC